jgi:uncharacterized protein YbjT (DUF2867 family)
MYVIHWANDQGGRIFLLSASDGAAAKRKAPIMYVVAGVTGNTGKVVAETLLSQKKPVRVIVRDAAKGDSFQRRGAEVAVAELDDVAGLTKALTGAEGAYLLLPPQMQSTDSRADNARRAQGYAKAIDASGVKHVVFLSSIGAHLGSGTGPILSVHDAEATLKKTRAALTFVRAGYFMENWGGSLFALGQGVLPTFLAPERPAPMIATKDIGTTAAKALLEGGRKENGTTVIELAGPRDYTPREVAEALARVVGKPITLQPGPEEAIEGALQGAGMNAHWAGLFREMLVAFNGGSVTWERGAAREVRGTTTVDDVLRVLVGH